jgi:hypothetical protein
LTASFGCSAERTGGQHRRRQGAHALGQVQALVRGDQLRRLAAGVEFDARFQVEDGLVAAADVFGTLEADARTVSDAADEL